jgi:hypothetical protein
MSGSRWILVVALLAGCGSKRRPPVASAPEEIPPPPVAAEEAVEKASDQPAIARNAERRARLQDEVKKAGILKLLGAKGEAASGVAGLVGGQDKAFEGVAGLGSIGTIGKGGGGSGSGMLRRRAMAPAEEEAAEPTPTRAWFPETFLFAPLVVTNSEGVATHQVRVPDRLTSWRVLALAHSRSGAQAGAETTFRGTLPTYVDPVVPPFLMTGDEVSLPIQIVNTTDEAVNGTLRLEVSGAALVRAPRPVRVAGQASAVAYAVIRAGRPGTATVQAALGNKDAVERSFPVRPGGRPVVEIRNGTLAAPRTLEITMPGDADLESASARLQVFPGALAVLRAELGAAGARSDPGSDAYALLLAGSGEKLLRSLGGEPEPNALRTLGIVAGQRAVRAARAPAVMTAALFAEPALANAGNPMLERLGERLAATVAAAQRPDGTFAGGDGWKLQRLMVATADCVRAVRAASGTPAGHQRATRVALRARAAFERNLSRVEDAYTAAVVLASDSVDGTLRDKLRERVRKALRQDADGARSLPVGKGIVRDDDVAPTEIEATALAVLGLRDDPAAKALLPDLGARLLSAYDPDAGFGDGRTNLAALTAVLALFADPLPRRVTVTFSQDGRSLGERVLEGAKLREVLALEVPLQEARGPHKYEIRAEPAVPGLGYALALKVHVPWKAEPAQEGLELSIETPRDAQVGKPADIKIHAAAPGGVPFTIRHALPAGVQGDVASLEALVEADTIKAYHREDGAIILEIDERDTSESFSAHYRVIPTLAGKLNAGASSILARGSHHDLPPARWTVR